MQKKEAVDEGHIYFHSDDGVVRSEGGESNINAQKRKLSRLIHQINLQEWKKIMIFFRSALFTAVTDWSK